MYPTRSALGHTLRSAAQRYCQPACQRDWPPPPLQAWIGSPLWIALGRQDLGGDQASGSRSPAMARLEAVLFLSREPLGSRKLARMASLADGTEARRLVRKLNQRYDKEGCAFRAVEIAGGFQLRTRPQFAPWLQRLSHSPPDVRLSSPAMETLAVVAYRQPVLRAEVEAIRGVQCGEILRQLLERDLVRIAGRSEELGRPYLYGTTRRFLEVFGLRHLDELSRFQPPPTPLSRRKIPDPPQPDTTTQEPEPELVLPSPANPPHGRGTESDDCS